MLGEEGAARPTRSAWCWVIDPIDGTTNYVYGHPGYNVSIAAQVDGETVAGVVVDVVHDEVFAAVGGAGATCNGRPIRCNRGHRPGHRPGRRPASGTPPSSGPGRPRC